MKKSKLFKKFEDKFKVKVVEITTIIEDISMSNGLPDSYNFKWGYVPNEVVYSKRQVETDSKKVLSKSEKPSDIYSLTHSGFESRLHPINKGWNTEENFETKSLHPLLLIRGEKLQLWFRMDNPMIREMFYDLEPELTDFELKGEQLKEFQYRELEHKEYLEYCLNRDLHGTPDWIELWLEKCEEGKKHLLHSEYLKQKEKVSCN